MGRYMVIREWLTGCLNRPGCANRPFRTHSVWVPYPADFEYTIDPNGIAFADTEVEGMCTNCRIIWEAQMQEKVDALIDSTRLETGPDPWLEAQEAEAESDAQIEAPRECFVIFREWARACLYGDACTKLPLTSWAEWRTHLADMNGEEDGTGLGWVDTEVLGICEGCQRTKDEWAAAWAFEVEKEKELTKQTNERLEAKIRQSQERFAELSLQHRRQIIPAILEQMPGRLMDLNLGTEEPERPSGAPPNEAEFLTAQGAGHKFVLPIRGRAGADTGPGLKRPGADTGPGLKRQSTWMAVNDPQDQEPSEPSAKRKKIEVRLGRMGEAEFLASRGATHSFSLPVRARPEKCKREDGGEEPED
ncbi:hypothetical protein EJ06DRAFT_172870 [Trichodelitschia bisporula]|uniref:Uncharacterized protein n=1 Tax=Trichodelitschia bisporula TaxID=703511 RepID=A0A6G1HLE1_9PEZI|nr:hypothetical protein EJ06DRAFT_172870 [Trichodelitschia bisporula]